MSKLAINGGEKAVPNGINVSWPIHDSKEENAVLEVVRSGNWWRGGTIEAQQESVTGAFEREFADFHNADYALTVCNGTVALEAAFRAAGVRSGDEGIVPALSFVVSASVPLLCGAVPIFADCDPETFQPDPQ